jgi:hypothetical protein
MEIRLAYQPHENRGTAVPVTIDIGGKQTKKTIDMRQKPGLEHGFVSLGEYQISKGEKVSVTISAENAGGNAHVDAVQILPAR